MRNISNLAPLALAALGAVAIAATSTAAKKPLDHSAFDSWETASNNLLSADGQWAAFAVNPQEGDGKLTFYNTRTAQRITIERGHTPSFTADGAWGVALIRPPYAVTRKARIDKTAAHLMPADSLAIVNLKTGNITRIGGVKAYRVSRDKGSLIAFESCDTTLVSPSVLADAKAGVPLIIVDPASGNNKIVKWVKEYAVSDAGNCVAVALRSNPTDSLTTDGIGVVQIADTSFALIDRDRKFYGNVALDPKGERLAYVASDDTVTTGTRRAQLYIADLHRPYEIPEMVFDKISSPRGPNYSLPHSEDPELQAKLMEEWGRKQREAAGKELYINQYTRPEFSHDGSRLIAGVAPYIAPDDTTIVSFERADLDIWRWDAPMTPPQESALVKELKEHTLTTVTTLDNMNTVLLTDSELATVSGADRWDADWAMVNDPTQTMVSHQWDYFAKADISVVNVTNGQRRTVGKAPYNECLISPMGKYVVWFDNRQYYAYDIASGKTRCISEQVPYPLWDESGDRPGPREAYGIACWSADDRDIMVYDCYDLWRLDPTGARAPECLTAGYGRSHNQRLRYVNPNPKDVRFVTDGSEMLLKVFDFTNKYNGLATLRYGRPATPAIRLLEGMNYSEIHKALNADVYSWIAANFSISPDVYVCRGTDFAKATKVTASNPQMADYRWGRAELVKWYAYDGSPAEGVLYIPEDLDTTVQHPMLSVFYETHTEDLYTHYRMEPSWSWINYPFYVSRGYVVFVPDIHYTAGVPGESAWNYVCSGVEAMCDRYKWIDPKRVGIDGQSWGGYQTAYLVTRTDMFACAGSGAPVSNMTSAFGGIRWGTGDSRQAQYEMGQSRIGRDLWSAPELYIANSPVFHADRCHTPLLIMHNDADGAVPWYQGIEMFMALRRLGRPVWMLQYNGEAHNLRERRNRKDITIRLQQFFDHYLKGDPMPEWMLRGIPITRKGQEMGTELINN
ncbi:MAG: prolyl oligopeptidase family serine peptidase [Muribaculaceae bacterium]|nr:prolyl oligopeptidase family serine peptidase [Muribaculaceae bacterium]